MLHMKLQSQLIGQLAKRFGLPKNVVEPADIFEYQAMLEAWTQTFPPTYSLQSPDTSQDATYPWIVLHRHYLYTVAFSMLLDPVRSCFAEKISSSSPPERLRIRKDGITYALKLMGALYGFFDHVYPRDAKFHFVIFTIFDTAAVLATVILHDEDQSAPLRSEILDAIESAYEMVIRLSTALPAAITYRDILSRLRKKVMRHLRMLNPSEHEARRKRARVVRKPLSALSVSQRSKMPPSSEPPPIMSTPAGSKSQSSANAPGVDSGAKLPASNSVDVPPEHEPKSASILNTSLEGTQPTQSSVRHFEVPSTIMTHPSEQDGQTPKTMTEATRPRLVRPTFVPPAGPTIEPHYGADTTPALNVAPAPTPEAAGEHMLHTASVPVLRPSPLPVVESGSILEATPEQQQESHGQPTTVSPAPTFPGSSLPRGQAGLSELDTFDFMHYMPSFLPSQNNSWVDTLHPTNEFSEEVLPTVFADLIGPSGQVLPNLGDTTMSLNDLGQLGDLWRWQSLDLDLVEDGQASNQSNQTPSQTSDEPPTQQQGS
jgi:hypothetical protein